MRLDHRFQAAGVVGYAVDRNTGAGFDYPTVITVSLRSLNPGPTGADSSAFISSAQPPAAVPAEAVVANAGVAAAAPKAAEIGQSSRQVERLAKEASCSSDAAGILLAKGPGYETYSVACTNGDVLMFRCEFQNCRALK